MSGPDPRRLYVDQFLEGALGADGAARWWDRPRRTLDDRTPAQEWALDLDRVVAVVESMLFSDAT